MPYSIEESYPDNVDDMVAYEKLLQTGIENRSSFIPNKGPHHASLMMTKLFERTRQEVAMVVGQFSGVVSNNKNYLEALENFLKKEKSRIRVLILDEPNQNSLALKTLKDYREKYQDNFPSKVSVKQANNDVKMYLREAFRTGDSIANLSVFDDDKYRFEFAPQMYSAFGTFDDPVGAKKLLSDFDKAFNLTLQDV